MSHAAVAIMDKPFTLSCGIYRNKAVEGLYIRPAQPADDAQLLQLVAQSMPSNGVRLSFERYPSYFKATQTQYEHPCVMVVVADDQPERILAMFNLGTRRCFINGLVKPLRYISDLRITRTPYDRCLTTLLMSYLGNCYPADEIYQTVTLNDNSSTHKLLLEDCLGIPKHYVADQVETYTLSNFKTERALNRNLSICPMTRGDISAVNRFIRHMADYYNFLPAYDFKGLAARESYWQGLSLNDFYIIKRSGQIVGLFGLWNQKSFKQIRITHYSKLLTVMRPAYNCWAKFNRQLRLPQKGDTLNYIMLHSVLCHPYDIDLFENMLRSALQKAKARKYHAICFSLAQNDPRRDCRKLFIGQKVKSIHAFHSLGTNPLPRFDARRISYLECGRI